MTSPNLPSPPAPQTNADRPASVPIERRKVKRVEYKVTLTSAEHAQLIALRDTCREAGQKVTKAALLRAAVAMLNEQSSHQIASQLQQLVPLDKPRQRKAK